MIRSLGALAAVAAALSLTTGASAQSGPGLSGNWTEPETGAVIAFAPCTDAAAPVCGTVAGWFDDSPLPRRQRDAFCGSQAAVQTGPQAAGPGQATVFEGRGILKGLGSFSAEPGPLGILQVYLDSGEVIPPRRIPPRRIVIPHRTTWYPARSGWTACDPAPTS
jgi:hypothetical protein